MIALFLFPLNVMGTIPGLILWLTQKTFSFSTVSLARGGFLILLGLPIIYHTVSLFTDFGEGTPAPYDPPRKFVVRGLFRHVRNPMMIGVILILFGEAVIFRSWPLMIWGVFFIAANLIYIPWFEEPELKIRFGSTYETYLKWVPRWIPRVRPWKDGGKVP